jgi:hypothetical protein
VPRSATQVSNPKFQGLRTEFLNHESVSIANDTLAVIDRSDRGEDKKDKKAGVACAVRVFDSATGKQLGEPITHNLEITDLALSHAGSERKLVCSYPPPRDSISITCLRGVPLRVSPLSLQRKSHCCL